MRVRRHLRVVFSKKQPGEPRYVEVARGDWTLGREPELSGEPIPPDVLTGIEKQIVLGCKEHDRTVTYDRSDVRYAMDFEVVL